VWEALARACAPLRSGAPVHSRRRQAWRCS
jgi:hypothetical protein